MSRYSAGESSPIKVRRPAATSHCMRKGQHLQGGEHQRGLGEASYYQNSNKMLCPTCTLSAHAPTFCWRIYFVDANILSTPNFCQRLTFVDANILSTPIFCRFLTFVDTNILSMPIFCQRHHLSTPVQYGRDAAHKSRVAWAVISLGVYMSERQHIYEDLNESSSASPGGSQQLEIPPSPNSRWAPNFSADIFARRGDFNALQDYIARLYFYQTPIFCIPAKILGGAYILYIRQYFHETPRF